MPISKINISKRVSKKLSITQSQSIAVVNKFISIIKKNYKLKKIKIPSFGTFMNKNVPKRIGRNPKTKESYIINPRKKLIFKASNKIKEDIN